MKTLYLFLDFDGVLNNANESFGRDELGHLNQSNLNIFGLLINELNKLYELKIVINSAWKMNIFKGNENWLHRFLSRIPPLLKYEKYFIDTTPTYGFWEENYSCKRFEVESWIVQRLNNSDNSEFLILDDSFIPKIGNLKFIKIYQTDCNIGLIAKDIPKILEILK